MLSVPTVCNGDVESFAAAAEILKECGADKIFMISPHGSADAPCLIEESPIDEVHPLPALWWPGRFKTPQPTN